MGQTDTRTLNNLIATFESLANRHLQINTFLAGQDSEVGASETLIYPALLVNPVGAELPKGENGFSMFSVEFNIEIVDLVHKDNSNEFEVLSDGLEVLKDIINEFQNSETYQDSEMEIENSLRLSPIHDKYGSEVSGWEVNIVLIAPNRNNFCDSPII